LYYFDWGGSSEVLQEYKKCFQEVCEAIDGIKFNGAYMSHQQRWSNVWIFKVDGYDRFVEAIYKTPSSVSVKEAHGITEILSET
jgi:hypothetical protein